MSPWARYKINLDGSRQILVPLYRTTRRHIPDSSYIRSYRRQSRKSVNLINSATHMADLLLRGIIPVTSFR